ncbi:MAG TPA: AAA family ATPase [Thermoanaerobaculia bacterium]|jgi:predicted ATPase|nr:AAA family ATPase [Thermoanaerobaculia bacterium]
MAISRQVRLLQSKWRTGSGWPKRLEWIEISGLRGWSGQRFELRFPIVAVSGENGSGKSTIIQAAASIYNPSESQNRGWFASDFFPETFCDRIENATIRASIREGLNSSSAITTVRKTQIRWRGNPRRVKRHVEYIDLSRIQPVSARIGFSRLAKAGVSEKDSQEWDTEATNRLSDIMGRQYTQARRVLTSADPKRRISVLTLTGSNISGFHQGGGELTMTELLEKDPQKYSLVLIDEVETSLHPRAQRRLIRDLADLCRERELQIVLTTHSPYVLEELPPEGRGYILRTGGERQLVMGVSPDFAMTKMDEIPHPECDIYVEDERAEGVLREVLVVYAKDAVNRCKMIRYGTANVGQALGQMVAADRFPRPSLVFVDGDQPQMTGCIRLPGSDAPERVIFDALQKAGWGKLHERLNRTYAEVADACARAQTGGDHHEWVSHAATELVLGGDVLWSIMCSEWASLCLAKEEAVPVVRAITETLALGHASLPQEAKPIPPVLPPTPAAAFPVPARSKRPPATDKEPWLFTPKKSD